MAKQKNNVVTHGLSGTVGGMLVFRQTATGTVVQSPPRASGKSTEAQQAHRRRFQRAVVYGKASLEDPARQQEYAAAAHRKNSTPFNVAVADFMHAPDIEVIDVSGYHGQPGDVIRIEVTDDFAVWEVKVLISNADGSIVEEGYAEQSALKYEWIYTATAANPGLTGDRIEVYASDIPGNISKAEETVSITN
jgi:hypothetical protein